MTRYPDRGGRLAPDSPQLQGASGSPSPGHQPNGKTEGRYRFLFENSPISLWEENWAEVGRYLDQLRSTGLADLRTHFQQHPEAVVECVRRVHIIDVNRATLDLLRAKDKAELLVHLDRFFTPESLEVFCEEVIALAGGSRRFEAESVHRTLTGEIIEVALCVNVVPDNDGPLGTVLVSLQDITQRKRAEADFRRQRETLRQMLEVQEHERRLVSYEIHDGLAQQLAGALMLFQTFREQAAGAVASWSTFDAALQVLREAMAESRRLIDDLRPAALEEAGLIAAVEKLVAQLRARWDMEIELVCNLPSRRYASTLEAAVFRSVQESLTNVRVHSRSKRARVELAQRGDRLSVEIRDWGAGFDPRQIPDGHYGLEGIRERARLLGGQVTIESAPGKGTRIVVELPVPGP